MDARGGGEFGLKNGALADAIARHADRPSPAVGDFSGGRFVEGAQAGVQHDVFAGLSGYGATYADPPWRFTAWSEKGLGRSPDGRSRAAQRQNRSENHYKTMTLDELKALPVGALAAKDCVLFLWCVDPLLPQAFEVGAAWGFEYKTVAFVWAKLRRETSERHKLHEDWRHKLFPMGTGYWTRANPETCLLFTRGSPKRLSTSVRKLLISPRREHSRKPDEARSEIERLVAGPYIELFARTTAPGWDSWGNEPDRFAEAQP